MRKPKILICSIYNHSDTLPYKKYNYCTTITYDNKLADKYLYSNDLKLMIKFAKLLQLRISPTVLIKDIVGEWTY